MGSGKGRGQRQTYSEESANQTSTLKRQREPAAAKYSRRPGTAAVHRNQPDPSCKAQGTQTQMFFISCKYEANSLSPIQPCYDDKKEPKANIPEERQGSVLYVSTGSCNKDNVKGLTQTESSQ